MYRCDHLGLMTHLLAAQHNAERKLNVLPGKLPSSGLSHTHVEVGGSFKKVTVSYFPSMKC